VGFGAGAPRLPHALAQVGIAQELGQPFVPLGERPREVTTHAVANHLGVHAHRARNDGNPARHVLDGLERALSCSERVVAQGHEPDVEGMEVVHLVFHAGVVLPGPARDLDPRALEACGSEEQEPQGKALGELPQDGSQGLEVDHVRRSADPA